VRQRARELYQLSLHGTALSLGAAYAPDTEAVEHLQRLVQEFDPMLVSEHLSFAWATVQGKKVHLGDLLPVARNTASLDLLCSNIDRVQQSLSRPILIENVSSYLSDMPHEIDEAQFLVALTERTGCRLLLDINNLFVNAHNARTTDRQTVVRDWMDQLPADSVGEIHLAGFTAPEAGAIAIDDHAQPVSDECWEAYAYAVRRFGAVPTLVEWDNALPEWDVLQQQAAIARTICNQVIREVA
jgi:uncharacterized protein (UPF0276 family)